ncbi:MAG: hypothetical protein Q8L47_03055 [bacterium]|nr:hypothetical protein [bacterium]
MKEPKLLDNDNKLDSTDLERYNKHLEELRAYGLPGLEGRLDRGLDHTGMLAVQETRKEIQEIAQKLNVDIENIEVFTKALHVGDIWKNADELAMPKKTEVKVWMLLADLCHEVNGRDLSKSEYLEDSARIKQGLLQAKENPEALLEAAVQKITKEAHSKFDLKEEVPFSEDDAFLYMAIAGEKYGVCKAGNLYFAGANELDFSVLDKEGLTKIEKEDRGRISTFFQKQGRDAVKKLYPGLAIVFDNEELALRLAKSADNLIQKDERKI